MKEIKELKKTKQHIAFHRVGNWIVSTIDLKVTMGGIETLLSSGTPLFDSIGRYETMVFSAHQEKDAIAEDGVEHYCTRYDTERDAERNHHIVLAKLAMGDEDFLY